MAFERLARAYAERLGPARAVAAQGEKVVGLVGAAIPRELVLASGRTPVLVTADLARPIPTAEHYIDPVVAPEIQALFDAAVAGEFEFLDLLVISRPYAQLYYYLKEIYRLGRAPKLPPLAIYDLIQSRREAVRAYNLGRTRALAERLGRDAPRTIDDASLGAAIAAENAVRARQRELQDLRWQGRVSGSEALQALGAGWFVSPKDYAAALEAWLGELQRAPARSGTRVVVSTAEPFTHAGLHEALEGAGMLVVAEDDAFGARAAGEDVGTAGDLLEAITEKVWLDVATPAVNPYEDREAWFRAQAARPDVEAVVFYVPPSDRQFGWDLPRLARFVAGLGKPALLVRQDAADPAGRAAISAKAAEFLKAPSPQPALPELVR